MKKTEFTKELAKEIEEYVKSIGENDVDPLEFTSKIISMFEKRDILNPTHFVKDGEALRQISGWEPENEDSKE